MQRHAGGIGDGVVQRLNGAAAAAQAQLRQLPLPVVVVEEVHGLHHLHGDAAIQLTGLLRLQHMVVVLAHILVSHVDVHAALIGHQMLQIGHPHLDLPAAGEVAAPVDIQEGGAVAQIYHAQVTALLPGAAVVGLQHGAVRALAGGQHPQAEARPA